MNIWARSPALRAWNFNRLKASAESGDARGLWIGIAVFPFCQYPVPYLIGLGAAAILAVFHFPPGMPLLPWATGLVVAHLLALQKIGDDPLLRSYKDAMRRLAQIKQQESKEKKAAKRKSATRT